MSDDARELTCTCGRSYWDRVNRQWLVCVRVQPYTRYAILSGSRSCNGCGDTCGYDDDGQPIITPA